jgi:hypothetical protein
MRRPDKSRRFFLAAMSLAIAVGLGAARTEKLWVEVLAGLDLPVTEISMAHENPAPFDPKRVPQSGGMASRLLAGITVKHT